MMAVFFLLLLLLLLFFYNFESLLSVYNYYKILALFPVL